MNLAPRNYDEEFYKREIEGQKSRLEKLKGRQAGRQRKYGGGRAQVGGGKPKESPSAATAAPQQAKHEEDKDKASTLPKPSSSLQTAVLHALDSSTLQRDLPCSLDKFISRIEGGGSQAQEGPSPEEVADELRLLAARKRSSGDLEIELKGEGVDISIVAVRSGGSGKESRHSSKRQKAN